MPAATIAVIGAVPEARAGIAAALLNSARQVGSMAGVALLGALVAAGGVRDSLTVAMLVAAAAYGLGLVVAVLALDRPASNLRGRAIIEM
jgi:MFS transporter, DHA2 family, methylenomycin A resistance protein